MGPSQHLAEGRTYLPRSGLRSLTFYDLSRRTQQLGTDISQDSCKYCRLLKFPGKGAKTGPLVGLKSCKGLLDSEQCFLRADPIPAMCLDDSLPFPLLNQAWGSEEVSHSGFDHYAAILTFVFITLPLDVWASSAPWLF